MKLFFFTKDIHVRLHETNRVLKFKAPRLSGKPNDQVPLDNIYFTTESQFQLLASVIQNSKSVLRIGDAITLDMVLNRPDFPKQIPFYNVGKDSEIFLNKEKNVKIAAINGMGYGIGDSIVGLRALEIFYQRIKENYANISIAMFRRTINDLRSIYLKDDLVDQLYMLPQPVSELLKYDYYVSFESFIASPEFNSMPMVDYYLAKLGMDPSSVVRHDKRNSRARVEVPAKLIDKGLKNQLRKIRQLGRRLLMFHPTASDRIRSIPEDKIPEYINYLIDNTEYTIISTVPIAFSHERFFNLSHRSKSMNDYIYIISNADAIISVDTSTFHISDSFDIPTVVLFTTIPPEKRLSYYPKTRGIWLGEGIQELSHRHKGFSEKDTGALTKIFNDFDLNHLLEELEKISS